MSLSRFLFTVFCALNITFVLAGLPIDYTVRNAPGASKADTYQAVRRAITEAAAQKRDTRLRNSTILDRSWDEAVLLKFEQEKTLSETNNSSLSATAGVEIVCTTCYIKGVATAELSIEADFNARLAIQRSFNQVGGKVGNFTNSVDDYFVNYTKGVVTNLADGIDLADFALPTMNFDFNMDIPTIPECKLRFQFDDLELYMNISTILSLGSTYQLNLYSSNTPLGISITQDLEVGVIFSVDLILSVEGEIDISSGFHIKLDDGAAIEIALFGDDISDIIFNGGQFEFLPVTIQSAGIVFSAVLRVGVHAGFQLVAPRIPELTLFDKNLAVPTVGGGIEVGVFANVAEFVTNVTFAPEEECKLQVVQSYQLALGAAAGATVAIGSNTWGPVATASVPIWYTEIASICAIQKTAAPEPSVTAVPAAGKRQDLATTTVRTEVTYTGVSCQTPGLVNCPASAQITSQSIETRTIVTAIPEGSDFTFPNSIKDTVSRTVAFGSNAISVPTTAGSPVSFVPPPPKATGTDENGDDNIFGDNEENIPQGRVRGVNKKLILSLTLGLGFPVLIVLCSAGIIYMMRRRKRSAQKSKNEAFSMVTGPYHAVTSDRYLGKQSKPGVQVTEIRGN